VIEALVTGRVALDLYPEQSRRALEDVETFRQYAGGFAANVATGLARLGVRTALFSAVGDDGHGRHIRRFLEAAGVDCGWLATDPERRTALAFCEMWPPDDFPITYHRTPTCPDWEVSLQDAGVDLQVAAAVPLLYISGTSLARARSLEAMVALAELRAGGPHHTILDLDWRPMLWASAEDFAARVRQVLPAATTVVGGDKEWAAARLDPAAPSAAVRVAKHGPDGCSVHRPDGSRQDVAPIRVDAVNGLGAGDAFAAGWGHALLRDLDQPADVANAAGAIVAARHACSASMPTLEELEGFRRSGVLPG
jgi:5-dehydro-2-deoxygluconokinase